MENPAKIDKNGPVLAPKGFKSRPDGRALLSGIGLILLNSMMWAASDTAAQALNQTLPAIEVTWLRYLFHDLMLFPLLRGGMRAAFKTRHLPYQLVRGAFWAFSAICFIVGLKAIPVADATSVTFVGPFVIMGLAFLILGEAVEIRRWMAAAVGLAGVLVIVQPGGEAFSWSSLWPLFASIFGSSGIIMTRLIPHDDPRVTMLYTGGVGLVIVSLLVPFYWVTPTISEFAIGGMVGLFAALAHITSITAYRLLPASLLAPFGYAQLIWASLFGFAMFGVWPTVSTLSGAVLIIGSGLYSAWRERLAARAVNKESVAPNC